MVRFNVCFLAAQVIAAEGEKSASRSLKDAADVMRQSPCSIQLRYLQTLNTICAEKQSTILFPIPMNMLQAFESARHAPPPVVTAPPGVVAAPPGVVAAPPVIAAPPVATSLRDVIVPSLIEDVRPRIIEMADNHEE